MATIEPVRIVANGVPGLLFTPPDHQGPLPLILLGHGAHTGKDDLPIQVLCRSFARHVPAAVLVIDCPGHGERKPEHPVEYLEGVERAMADPAIHRQLAEEWNTAAAVARSVEPRIDDRTAYVGFSMGSIFGASIVPDLDDVTAVVLALGGFVGPARDATINELISSGLERFGTREVLMLSMTGDESFPFAEAVRAFGLIPGPKRMFVWEGGHVDIPGEAVRLGGQFLQRCLAR